MQETKGRGGLDDIGMLEVILVGVPVGEGTLLKFGFTFNFFFIWVGTVGFFLAQG